MSVANRPTNRPLSPHLQVYRLPITARLSILHRATGVALSLGALYLVAWVVFASASPGTYAKFQAFNASIVGRIVLGGWLFCLFYHLCNGIRHLSWDMDFGFELASIYLSGWLVVSASVVLTLATWIIGMAAGR